MNKPKITDFIHKYSLQSNNYPFIYAFAPMEPYTANPILRELMAVHGAQMVFRPKIIPFHYLESPDWQIYEKITDINTITTPNKDPVYDCIQLLARPDDPIKKTIQDINDNAEEYGIDWIDLNFSCPGHKVRPQNRGGELLSKPEKVEQVIEKVLKYSNVPVSVKIRRGYSMQDPPAAICSTLKQYSLAFITINRAPVSFKGENETQILDDFIPFQKAIELVDEKIPIFANGQLNPFLENVKKGVQGCVGMMIGNGALGNPSIFSSSNSETTYNVYNELESLFSIIHRYTTGNSGRWTTIGPLKQLLFFYIKKYYDIQQRQLPAGYGITKWFKQQYSKPDFISALTKVLPDISKEQFEIWLAYIN